LRHNIHHKLFVKLAKLVTRVLMAMLMRNPWIHFGCGGVKYLAACLLVGASSLLNSQVLMTAAGNGGAVRLLTLDAAILEARETRKDLPCTVLPVKPILGFDLKFHAGYEVTVPLKELAGPENQLTMVFRVIPEGRDDEPVYFSQKIAVPAIEEDAGGPAFLQGQFALGEGKYKVDWLMRDRSERVCSSNWDIDAALPSRDKQMTLDIAGFAVQPTDGEIFKQEPPVERETRDNPLNLKVVVNFAPQDSGSAAMQPLDLDALLAILRSIARDPHVTRFSVVAYNMQEQRVIYRQDGASQIDFPALGQALKSLNLGTVDLRKLSQKNADSVFLGELITTELKDDKAADAVIFAGPKVMLEEGLPPEALKQIADVKTPVFYLNYNLNPQANPWRDAISSAVKSMKGAEYTITRPRDVFFSWMEIVGRIVKSKFSRTATASASSQ
jgi:hypothetical protein